MTPCRECMNCRNGFPGLCLRDSEIFAQFRTENANTCNDCGKAVGQRQRYCPACKKLRRKAANRAYNRKRQNGQVEATTVKAFSDS